MPHLRNRLGLSVLQRKLRFSRVVTIQGARQTGKSVLARDLFKGGVYVTFDRAEEREEAKARIGVFLEQLRLRAHGKPIVIDEAQKVPALFDQVKATVDEDTRPGQFLLLGSTEFSIEAQVNESLTGRVSRTKLFPLVLSETVPGHRQRTIDELPRARQPSFTRRDLLRFLGSGGFPAIFSVRDDRERLQRLDEWLRLTCERDVMQFKRVKPDPDLCLRVLQLLPHLPEPNIAAIANRLKVNARRVETQIKALLQIFAVHELRPHPVGTGKALYYLIDPSLAQFCGGDFQSQLDAALLTEFFAKASYSSKSGVRFSFFRGAKGGRLSLLIESGPQKVTAVKWFDAEKIDLRELAIFRSFAEKAKRQRIQVQSIAFCGISRPTKVDEITVLPWEFAF